MQLKCKSEHVISLLETLQPVSHHSQDKIGIHISLLGFPIGSAHLPPTSSSPRCAPCPGHCPSSCIRLSTSGLRASAQALPLPEASLPSSHLGLAKASCGSQLTFLALGKAVFPNTRASLFTLSLVSCTFPSWLLSICNSTVIQCSFIPTCPPLQPEGTTETRLPYLPLLFMAPSTGLGNSQSSRNTCQPRLEAGSPWCCGEELVCSRLTLPG